LKTGYSYRYVLKVRKLGTQEGMDISSEWAETEKIEDVESALKDGVATIIANFEPKEAESK
jgi:hypothetical protein